MCGIAGFAGRFEPSLLTSMSVAIAHRGPDGEGHYLAERDGIGLAHRRLAIIDLSPTGAQPMTDPRSGVTITYNGEIYNYRELRARLQGAGVVFRGQSDTEVILQLYIARGDPALAELNGIFALAIWDPRVGSLLLARDGAGVKPLYIARTPSGVLFASELKALLACADLDRTVDHAAVWSHLTYLWAPAPQTMLKSVRKLEPGHALRIRAGQVERKWKFYELPYPTPPSGSTPAVAADQFRSLLDTAVQRQMVADVEVGAFLSGGLDSSSIVAFARKYAHGGNLQCFTIETSQSTASEGLVDDLPYAIRVADHLGVSLHTVRVGPEMADHFERMIRHLDEPQADLAPLNALFISQLARSSGIKVLLSGAGGDDILTGYRRHFALMQERWWRWLPAPLRRALQTSSGTLPAGNPLTRRLRKAFAHADLDGDERLISYFYWLAPDAGANLLTQDVRASLRGWAPANPLAESLAAIPAEQVPLNRMLFLEAKHFLADHNLNYTDKMGMAVGVEVRVPFLDPDVVQFAAALPASFKQHGREGKWIFKRAMQGLLPDDVIYRPKSGFGVPLRRWLRAELKPMVDDLLSHSSLTRRSLFDPAAVAALRTADHAGKIDAAYPILALCSLEMWCRIFLD